MGKDPIFEEMAKKLGNEFLKRGISLVYGGGTVGLMGAISKTIHEGGGHVKGIIPASLAPREVSGESIGEIVVVDDMHSRKLEMYSSADAFIAMPGGFGTLEELFEIITWLQLGIHTKPIGLLNVQNFYDPLLQLRANATQQGFVGQELAQKAFVVSSDPIELIELMEAHVIPKAEVVWIKPSET
eukprot:TRINITY_DN22481_c0_g1_i1.p1 TRINITY_DN22481_c0_g1~~TRINITY_DN22481_c0_g1_i1.p1  ORF type:complete len:206 (-),score=64.80 TRINITY_DN22481_c0_g1_i1:16-570(-)